MFPEGARFALSLTFDLEMCSNFPYWSAVWDHRKGAIDGDTWRYVEKLGGLAADAGVKFQWFVLGSTLEAGGCEPLRRLAEAGHAVGNHTFRHVNVKAQRWEDLQVTYRENPALRAGLATPLDAVRHEIRATNRLIRDRLGAVPRGFRTPGGFNNGLRDAPAVQALLREEGFAYVSSHYDYPVNVSRGAPRPAAPELEKALRQSLTRLQPSHYPDGLLEIPMMGIGDIGAFRVLDLEREEWIRLLEAGVDAASEAQAVYSVLLHPSVLAARDPHAATVRRLLARAQQKHGWITTNDAIADRLAGKELLCEPSF